MIGWEIVLYVYICGAMLMLSVIGLESAIAAPGLDRWAKRFFVSFFAILVLSSATFFLELIGYVQPSLRIFEVVAYYLQSVLYVAPYPMLAFYLLHYCGEDWRRSRLFRVILVVGVVYLALLVWSLFTDWFYYIAPDNQVHLGPGYVLLLAPLLAMLIFIVVGVVRRRDKLPRQYYPSFLFCLLPIMIALVIHLIVPTFLLVNVGMTVSAYSMYRVIVSNLIEQDLRHQREIAQQRTSIALLQMRPHFIYNTMTSIYYLCDQDPQLAKQVTTDFTTYLRKNFTAIASEEPIPFSEELEHTRAYLAVEQAQFEDELFVNYDTPHTQFRVPPLTLQPIVENAVKHGMDLDSGPLHIWIRTSETDSGSEIVVSDDGPGFDPAIADDPRTTLANIRQRLDMMCGGTLDIALREGGGTVVRATVSR